MGVVRKQPSILEGGFEAAFRRAARRVLLRRGFPESGIEAEIDRLRKVTPSFKHPATIEELEAGLERPR